MIDNYTNGNTFTWTLNYILFKNAFLINFKYLWIEIFVMKHLSEVGPILFEKISFAVPTI